MIKYFAIKYHSLGLSVIPCTEKKQPAVSWKKYQSELISPGNEFNGANFIAIVAGSVSGNLECIDIDTKYDLTGKLFNDYKNEIYSCDPHLLKKLIVEQSPSGGYHFIYRCTDRISGNKKLANRYATDEEKEGENETRILIETRGEGGYFVCAPSPGYKLVYGDFEKIQQITTKERQILFDCAYLFNEVKNVVKDTYKIKKQVQDLSPFDDFNERGDIVSFLMQEGWSNVRENGNKIMLLRPGSDSKWSADYDMQRKLLYVFSTSAGLEPEKAYNHSQVLAYFKFNQDYSETAKYLLASGYGTKKEVVYYKSTTKTKINLEDDNFGFIATDSEMNEYIDAVRNGTLKMGLETGIKPLDEHFRFKPNSLVIVNGHDNVGKSVVIWFFSLLSAIKHGWRWIIFSAENKTGFIKRKIMEFNFVKDIKDITEEEKKSFERFFEEHFRIIKNNESYSYLDVLNIGEKLIKKEGFNGFMIDPYNALIKDAENEHQYDYKAVSEMRVWIERNKCAIYLNCHSHTESLRRTYPQRHELYGYPMPPNKADTEGGGKFSNKADDFITIHRLTQHPKRFMDTEIHVRKIKETETGGKVTPFEDPVILKMIKGNLGFTDENYYSPILNAKVGERTEIRPLVEKEKQYNGSPITFYEKEREELPF